MPLLTAAWLRVKRTESIDSSGYITPTMSDGPSWVSMNRRDRLAGAHARAAADVVVVEEHREQPDVVARRFALLVVVGPDCARRTVGTGHQAAVELDQLEGLDLLGLAVLGDLEVGRLQSATGLPALVGDDDVDADEIDAGAEDRRLRRAGWSAARLVGLAPDLAAGPRRACGCCGVARQADDGNSDDAECDGAERSSHGPILDPGPAFVAALPSSSQRPRVVTSRTCAGERSHAGRWRHRSVSTRTAEPVARRR